MPKSKSGVQAEGDGEGLPKTLGAPTAEVCVHEVWGEPQVRLSFCLISWCMGSQSVGMWENT